MTSRSMTTIVVSPRERFTSLTDSLESLFRTISPEVPVVVVEGGTPAETRARLEALARRRPFRLISLPYMLKPNEARNIGVAEASTDYVVLADNDIAYEPGWLQALEIHAQKHGSDAVAPLLCIGPPAATLIHHAGGILKASRADGRVTLREAHRLMDVPLASTRNALPGIENHVCEFHCMMVRRSFLTDMGGLDERLITREQMDFAMRALVLGGKVTFAKDAVVTYMAKETFIPLDLRYHLFRWSDRFVVESMDAFEDTWGVALDRERIRTRWTAMHRSRAVSSAYPMQRRLLPERWFRRLVVSPLEQSVVDEQLALRTGRAPSIPHSLPKARIAEVLNGLVEASEPVAQAA